MPQLIDTLYIDAEQEPMDKSFSTSQAPVSHASGIQKTDSVLSVTGEH